MLLSLSTLFAQESLNASGGAASGMGGSMSYSVGQIAIETYEGIEGSVAQGVQQSYEISEVIDGPVKNHPIAMGITFTASVSKNLNADYLVFNIASADISNVSFQLFNAQGKLLKSIRITNCQTSIDMSSLAPAPYFAKVIQGNSLVKTFKVVKN